MLSEQHKSVLLVFVEKHIQLKKKCRKIIFTDEKKFNMDRPDGFAYYYHDLRKEPQLLSRR